jgi:hypothetical protein
VVSEEAARLIRQMDELLADDGPELRPRLFAAWDLSRRAADIIYRPECPWPLVLAALGPEPLRHEQRVFDLLDSWASGAIPDWCFAWLRRARQAAEPVAVDVTFDVPGPGA